MKKFIALIMVLITLISVLTSCTSFGQDAKTYTDELERKGFDAYYTSRKNSSEKEQIYLVANRLGIEEYVSWIDYMIVCQGEEVAFLFYCYDNKSAKNIEKLLKEEKEINRNLMDNIIKRQENIVYIGEPEHWQRLQG